MTNLSCTFCNLVINSQKQWDDHVVGQKHLRAVKLAEVSSCVGNNPPVATRNTPAPPRPPSPSVNHGADMTDASKLNIIYFLPKKLAMSLLFPPFPPSPLPFFAAGWKNEEAGFL